MLRRVPIIVIMGSTGTGKTKLSLQLAEAFAGEIISADSMQVYTDLDIVTAKVDKAARAHVRHHLLDVAKPTEAYTVVDFRNAAIPVIQQLLANSQPPIIVGGTNYYIESLLWDVLVDDKIDIAKGQKQQVGNLLHVNELAKMSVEELYRHLQKIDPQSANRYHPNNKRKILRAIEVYQNSGQTLSAKFVEQRTQPGGNRLGGPLRFNNTIIFWLHCNQTVLDERLNQRVDSMLRFGLLRELRMFHDKYSTMCSEQQSYTQGILQTIGYKEFVPYLTQYNVDMDHAIEQYLQKYDYKVNALNALVENADDASPQQPSGWPVLNSCLNELKLVTRRYSKKQIKWVNNRFLASKGRQVPNVYELDTSDVSMWLENVYQPAETIIKSYGMHQKCHIQPLPKRVHPGAGLNEEIANYCDICSRHFVGEFQWQLHLKSNNHRKRLVSQRKKHNRLNASVAVKTTTTRHESIANNID